MLAAFGCHKNIARPPVEEVPIRDVEESAAPAGSVSVIKTDKPERNVELSVTPPTSAAPDAPDPPRDKAFPKTTDACKKDDDCAATGVALGGDFMCCAQCKPVAGTRGWVRRVEQVCTQKGRAGWRPKCPPSDCEKPEVDCRAGKCVVR